MLYHALSVSLQSMVLAWRQHRTSMVKHDEAQYRFVVTKISENKLSPLPPCSTMLCLCHSRAWCWHGDNMDQAWYILAPNKQEQTREGLHAFSHIYNNPKT